MPLEVSLLQNIQTVSGVHSSPYLLLTEYRGLSRKYIWEEKECPSPLTHLLNYLLTYLLTYLPTYPPTFLLTYLPYFLAHKT